MSNLNRRLAFTLVTVLSTSLVSSRPAGAQKSAPYGHDRRGRLTIPVTVSGEGPFPFAVDTAAAHSVISQTLAERLKLPDSPMRAQVVGASGHQTMRLVECSDLRSEIFDSKDVSMAAIPIAADEGHEGVVGMDLFASGRLDVDFTSGRVTAGDSRPAHAGVFSAKAELFHGSIVIVDAKVGAVPVRAVIDTGARVTAANNALKAALGFAAGDPRLSPAEPIGGATSDRTPAEQAPVDLVSLGPARFVRPTMTFADLAIFRSLGIDDKPAIILGIDLLSTLKQLAIDYRRSELQIRP